MEHLLYFMHVDWGWIKQRPHFLAEELSRYFDVEVFHEKQYQAKKQKENRQLLPHLTIHSLWHIPMSRLKPLYHLNRFLIEQVWLRRKLHKDRLLWMAHPLHYTGHKRQGQFLIYDCMDDVLEFNCPPFVKQQMERQEALLCRDADLIFASSGYLKKKLEMRYQAKGIQVVNNAISLKVEEEVTLPESIESLFADKSRKRMAYIGTVAAWFNFDLLIQVLDQQPQLELVLFGPTELPIPEHPQIKYGGVVEHKYVSSIMAHADALVMPFVVNELIRSVNPVKAYEYIYAHKPVLMPHYEEVEQFEDFIYLYHNAEEAGQLMKQLVDGQLQPKASREESHRFALENNWENRAKSIVLAIEKARNKRK